jgi:hypothetical protein
MKFYFNKSFMFSFLAVTLLSIVAELSDVPFRFLVVFFIGLIYIELMDHDKKLRNMLTNIQFRMDAADVLNKDEVKQNEKTE